MGPFANTLPGTEPLTPCRYADRQDKFFVLLGIIGAGLNGAGMPIFSIVFGCGHRGGGGALVLGLERLGTVCGTSREWLRGMALEWL